jgi:hypothetical protein
LEKLKEAPKKQKMEHQMVKITYSLNFINMQWTYFMRDFRVFNNNYMVGEMPAEWENSSVIPTSIYTKCDKQKRTTIDVWSYYVHVIKYTVKV